jgi:hypothetical protein
MSESFPNPPKPFSPEKCQEIQESISTTREIQKEFEEKLEYAIQEGDTTALERAKELKVILEERLRKLQESFVPIAEKLRDPEIQKHLEKVWDDKKKISRILGIPENQISTRPEEALSGGIVYDSGGIYQVNLTSAEGLELPECVGRGLALPHLESAVGLKLSAHVSWSLHLESLKSAAGLKLPGYVGGSIYLSSLKSAEGLSFENVIIKRAIYFKNLEEKDFQELQKRYPNLDIRRI